jgi:hypothetical protein
MTYRLTCAVALTACLFGAPAMAADWSAWTAPVANAPAANEVSNPAAAPAPVEGTAPAPAQTNEPGYVRTAQFTTVSAPSAPLQDGLRNDHRWPAMERCINSATPAEFNNCLASAFMQDGTGHSLSLLPRRR